MERESFEDPNIAKQMNSAFINVKVDREEMPEIDHLYMSVCQAMTGHGGVAYAWWRAMLVGCAIRTGLPRRFRSLQ